LLEKNPDAGTSRFSKIHFRGAFLASNPQY